MLLISHDSEATLQLGKNLADFLQPANVLALYGDLGCGKTVLSRGIARGLGVSSAVSSPTFTIAQEYPLKNNLYFFHLDMYRIHDAESALAFGLEEFLFNPQAYTVIEWAERIQLLLPENNPNLISIKLAHHSENSRLLQIPSPYAEQIIERGLPDEIEINKVQKGI
jgi:tRNA threonylcarbamoyladenosine biosynthesis protein TsaE